MHVPSPNVCTPLDKSWAHSFSAKPHDGICPVKTRANTFINSHYISLPPNANGALPKLFLTVSYPSTMSRLPSRSLPTELSPSYFPRFPVRPPCPHFCVAPSQRRSPQAISHAFPSVHHVVASVSLSPRGALPKLFPTVSRPSALSSLKCRSPCGKVN